VDLGLIVDKLAGHLGAVLGVDASEVKAASALTDLGVESMALVELFVFIENEFRVELMSAGLEREDLATVQSLAEAIYRALPAE
jgi:acyl carrier protein